MGWYIQLHYGIQRYHFRSFLLVYSCLCSRDAGSDQCHRLCTGNGTDQGPPWYEYLPHGFLHAEPDRRHCAWLYLAADLLWHSGSFWHCPEPEYKAWLLGTGHSGLLAADRLYDDYLYCWIPGDVLEAAEIDGANSRQMLFKVIIPMRMPSITICTFLTITNGFKLFDQNLALTGGAPMKQTEMMALNIYNTFFGRVGFEGVGQAKAVLFFILVVVIAGIQQKLTRSKEVQQ